MRLDQLLNDTASSACAAIEIERSASPDFEYLRTGEVNLAEHVRDSGFAVLSISADHAIAASALPLHHRDPFDRMLIGQALVEGLTVMTRDGAFDAYDVPVEPV